MKDRIHKLMTDQHLQQNTFAELLGLSAGTLSGIFTGRTQPTLATINAIKAKFPKLRTDWLMYGTGPMFDDEKAPVGDAAPAASPTPQAGRQIAGIEPTLFSAPPATASPHGVGATLNNHSQEVVKFVEKPQRKITEIRIFYDDQTWETFVPKK